MAARNKKRIYRIIFANHGVYKHTIVSEPTEEKIYKRFNKLLKENKKVVFPMRYNNEKHVMIESDHEIYIIKCKDENDEKVNKIRDNSGKYTSYETNEDNWIVLDRANYDVEETFFVYGYHPKLQRKTFQWIYDEMVVKNAKNKYMFKTICLYHNKILIECDGKLDIILCKNKSDSTRFFNQLEKWAARDKFKYIFFVGDIGKSKHKSEWIKKIKDTTHWSNKKINRSSTRP